MQREDVTKALAAQFDRPSIDLNRPIDHPEPPPDDEKIVKTTRCCRWGGERSAEVGTAPRWTWRRWTCAVPAEPVIESSLAPPSATEVHQQSSKQRLQEADRGGPGQIDQDRADDEPERRVDRRGGPGRHHQLLTRSSVSGADASERHPIER